MQITPRDTVQERLDEVAPLVLLIEDEVEVAKMMQRMLRREGYRVQWHGSGQEGLAGVRATIPHAVVLDLCLGDLDGCNVMAELKAAAETRDVPIIVASAATHRLTPEERALTHAILQKPFTFAHLVAALERLRPAGAGDRAALA